MQVGDWGFPGGAVVKNLPARAGNAGDAGSVPGLGRSPGGGHGNPLQYSCLENPMDIGAWWATVHRVAKKQTRLKLSLCLSFCSKMRAQTGAETQVGSGCLELPVRCCLQLENQWLWDREDWP